MLAETDEVDEDEYEARQQEAAVIQAQLKEAVRATSRSIKVRRGRRCAAAAPATLTNARCSIQEDAAAQDLLRLHGRELRNMVRLMDVLIELREQTLIKLKTTVEQAKARDEFKRDLRAKIERVRAAAAAIGASVIRRSLLMPLLARSQSEERVAALSEALKKERAARRADGNVHKEVIAKLEGTPRPSPPLAPHPAVTQPCASRVQRSWRTSTQAPSSRRSR